MALANVLGFQSNDAFNRSLQSEKTDDHFDQLCPKLNIENIAQFLTLPPYADVRSLEFMLDNIVLCWILAGEIFENGQ